PFNIGVNIAEPGGARTSFRFGGAQLGPKLEVYDNTTAGMTRRLLQDTSRLPQGDPAKMVKIMIDSVEQNPAPKRIALGSDAYAILNKALSERLTALQAHKELAFSTDLPKNDSLQPVQGQMTHLQGPPEQVSPKCRLKNQLPHLDISKTR